jgi:hypothetical protein
MSEIKVGGWVKRIGRSYVGIEKDGIYKVKRAGSGCVVLENFPDDLFSVELFEPVEDPNVKFDIDKLKTGQRITLEDGRVFTVYTNCEFANDQETVYRTCIHSALEGTWRISAQVNENNPIVKVETPYTVCALLGAHYAEYTILWERKTESPEDLLKKELLVKMEAHKASLKELEDQINGIGK